jgi:alcohol dehydrogenase class IV
MSVSSAQRVICREGAADELAEVAAGFGAERILLVTGRASYARCGAEKSISDALGSYELTRFSDFDENPKLAHVLRGVEVFDRVRPDLVVAVGGGSAMDMAKMIDLFAAQPHPAIEYVEGDRPLGPRAVPLIALPTTAGSGSQSTHFAAVYVDWTKFSVAHASMLPDVAIVDPDFLRKLPKAVAAASGLDALNQGIESFWSIHATELSRAKARVAITAAWKHLARFVNHLDEAESVSRLGMARAAQWAGEAIDITKTTAPHAISYPITAHFGVSHGQAVGLVLPEILIYNAAVEANDCLHPGGVAAVRRSMDELAQLLGASNATEAARLYRELAREIGLSLNPVELGIKTAVDVETIVANGFNPQRVNNNPRRLTEEALRTILNTMVERGAKASWRREGKEA